jgi:hypothetical protein
LVVVVVDDGADPYSGPDAPRSSIRAAREPPVSIELDWTSVEVTCKATAFHEYSHTIADCAPEGTMGPELGTLVPPGKSPCDGQVGSPKGSVVGGVVGVIFGGLEGVVSVGVTTLVGAWTVEEDGVEGKGTVDGGETVVEGGLVPSGLRLTAGLTTAVRTSAACLTELPPRCAARKTITMTTTTPMATIPIHHRSLRLSPAVESSTGSRTPHRSAERQ